MRNLQQTLDVIDGTIEANGYQAKSFIAGYVMAMTTSQLMYLYQEIMVGYAYDESWLASEVVNVHLRREVGA